MAGLTLIQSEGGLRGTIGAGATARLCEESTIQELLDVSIGRSAGAGTAAGIAAMQSAMLGRVWGDALTCDQFIRPNGGIVGCLDNNHLSHGIFRNPKHTLDVEAIRKSGRKLLIAVTNLLTGQLEHLDLSHGDGVHDVIQASTGVPIVSKHPVTELDGVRYTDPDVSSFLADSIRFALQDSVNNVLAIDVSEPTLGCKMAVHAWLAAKTGDIATACRRIFSFGRDKRSMGELKDNDRVFILEPTKKELVAVGQLDNGRDNLQRGLTIGYELAHRSIGKIEEFLGV